MPLRNHSDLNHALLQTVLIFKTPLQPTNRKCKHHFKIVI